MFFDHINTDLFRPLVSKNARLYGTGLMAIYDSLVNQYIEGECTPKQARQVIYNALSSGNQNVEWIYEAEDEGEEILDHTSMAAQIYSVLKKTGWIIEMDDVGYRRIVYIPQQSSRLLQAIKSVSDRRDFSIGATFQGVYGALLSVEKNPVEYSAQIIFASKVTRELSNELKSVAASAREVTHKMREQSVDAHLFQTFFDEFLTECLGSFDHIKINSHPNRYRSETLSVVTRLLNDEEKLDQISVKLARENSHIDYRHQKQLVINDLNEIFRVFSGIPRLMDIIERYRSVTIRRTREAMQYSFQAVPEIGRKIETVTKALANFPLCESSMFLPAPVVHEEYVAGCRLTSPRKPKPEAQPTKQIIKTVNNWDIAYGRVYDEYLTRRTDQPQRLEGYILRELGDKSSITTCEMSIDGLEDLLAFLQLRELLHNSVPIDSPFEQLSKTYKVSRVEGVTTDNEYITAPSLRVERFCD
ncbi:Wadjet anti-phage system protein JetA family protein [Vibrio cholerae]